MYGLSVDHGIFLVILTVSSQSVRAVREPIVYMGYEVEYWESECSVLCEPWLCLEQRHSGASIAIWDGIIPCGVSVN